jgi:hypothetical protein
MDELPPDLDDLFGEARRDLDERDRLARVAARLGPALDAPAPPRWSWKIKALGGSLALGALLAALPLARRPAPSAATVATLSPQAPPLASSAVAPSSPPLADPSAAAPPASSSTTPAASIPPGLVATASIPTGTATSPTAQNSASDVVEEHALLAEARRSLGSSPAQTLSLVQQHQRRFPRGMLSTEREFLRISALSRLGRTGEARAAADRFLAAHRGSPYAAEVERLVGR